MLSLLLYWHDTFDFQYLCNYSVIRNLLLALFLAAGACCVYVYSSFSFIDKRFGKHQQNI